MTLTRQIAHNTIIQIIGKLLSTILGLLVIGMVARHLGQEGYGHFATIQAFLQFFGVIVDFGLYIILVKKISEQGVDVDRMVSNIFTLRLFSAVVFLGLAPLAVLFFPYPAVIKTGVALASLSVLFVTLNQVLVGVFQKNLRMDRVTIAELIGRVVLLGTTFLVVGAGGGLLSIMGTVVAGSFANFLFTFFFVRRYARIRLRADFAVWGVVLKESWPIAISIGLNLVYFKVDTLILSLTKPAEDVGIYGATYKVLEVLTTFPAMFAGLVLPVLTTAWVAQDRERFQRVLQRSVEFLALMALPLMVGTAFVAEPIMVLIAGEAFRASGTVLQIIIIATGSIFLGNLFGNAVVALNRQRQMIWVYGVVAVIALTGYVIFIPQYSYIGAAWVTVASEIGITIGAAVMVLRTSQTRIHFAPLRKILLATGAMALVLIVLPTYHFLFTIAIGIGVYGVALGVLRAVDVRTLREILRLR